MATIGGKLDKFEEQVSSGKLSTHSVFFLGGYNYNISTSFSEINPNGITIIFPTSAAQVKLSSSSTLDTAAGTGARTVYLDGLDASYNQITETVTLNGQTTVLTTQSFLRINGMRILTAGSTGSNQGVIYCGTGTVTLGVPASVYNYIAINDNVWNCAHYTVPAGYQFFISKVNLSADDGIKSGDFCFEATPFGGVPQRTGRGAFLNNNLIDFSPYYALNEKTDIRVIAKAFTGLSQPRVYCLVHGYNRLKSLDQ